MARRKALGANIIRSKFARSGRSPRARVHRLTGLRIADVFGTMVRVDGEDVLAVTGIRFTDGSFLALCPVSSSGAEEAHVVGEWVPAAAGGGS